VSSEMTVPEMFVAVKRHWRDMAEQGLASGDEPAQQECAFCDAFNVMGVCNGCPVKEFTGFSTCEGTPYNYAWDAWHALDSGDTDGDENFKACAGVMLAFLEKVEEHWKKTHDEDEGKEEPDPGQ
jgi:hypothetical protein